MNTTTSPNVLEVMAACELDNRRQAAAQRRRPWRLEVNLDLENCVKVDFWRDEPLGPGTREAHYEFALYLTDADISPMESWRRFINDMTTVAIFDTWKITILKPEETGLNGPAECQTWIFYVDVPRFLKILRHLRSHCPLKRVSIDLKDVSKVIEQPPLYTIAQLHRHPNARNSIAATLAHFRKLITAESFRKLISDLSHYIDRAIIYGHRDEFYFDGRKLPNGLGFNGGFIRHGNEYSIHT